MDGLTCIVCQKSYSGKYVLRRHIEQVHSQRRPFKCFHCDFQGYEKSSVKNHCKRVHEMTDEEFDVRATQEYQGIVKKIGRPKGSSKHKKEKCYDSD